MIMLVQILELVKLMFGKKEKDHEWGCLEGVLG